MSESYRYESGQFKRPESLDDAAYVRAERMLDRYGIAYIHAYPEVLFGIAPAIGSPYRTVAAYHGSDRAHGDQYGDTYSPVRPASADSLFYRVLDTYRMLGEMHTPYHLPPLPEPALPSLRKSPTRS